MYLGATVLLVQLCESIIPGSGCVGGERDAVIHSAERDLYILSIHTAHTLSALAKMRDTLKPVS